MFLDFDLYFLNFIVDSNDSFNSNLLIEPGQDLSSYPSSSGGGGPSVPPQLPLGHLPSSEHLPRFPSAANPGGYMVPRKLIN